MVADFLRFVPVLVSVAFALELRVFRVVVFSPDLALDFALVLVVDFAAVFPAVLAPVFVLAFPPDLAAVLVAFAAALLDPVDALDFVADLAVDFASDCALETFCPALVLAFRVVEPALAPAALPTVFRVVVGLVSP